MPPPKDLPGFYFDAEKNRYFPVKGPIPGTKRLAASSSSSSSEPGKKYHGDKMVSRKRIKPSDLLQSRELHGRVLKSNTSRHNFRQEYHKLQASHPMVWKYQSTTCVADGALEQLNGLIQTPRGLKETSLLSAGSINGSIGLYEVGNVGQYLNCGHKYMPELVWPFDRNSREASTPVVGSIWSSSDYTASFPSSISCIRRICKSSLDSTQDTSSFKHALVTTLGSGLSGGSVYTLNLNEPLDASARAPSLHQRTSKIASFDGTLWTADCSCNGSEAVLGTNRGAALINLETGRLSWVYRSKSDIFAQQFDQSGNVVLCGFRSGAIIEVDVRNRQSNNMEHSSRPAYTRQNASRIAGTSLGTQDKRSRKQRLEALCSTSSTHKIKSSFLKLNSTFMSSAVCSLVALKSDDKYFLASSMDGSMKLFDRRLLQRGAVQSYEGHVNSHTHLQLGVDPGEALVMSGGEDFYVRIWSIKTSELIFAEKFSDSIFSAICWPRSESISGIHGSPSEPETCDKSSFQLMHSWGAHLGSHAGLFYMHGT